MQNAPLYVKECVLHFFVGILVSEKDSKLHERNPTTLFSVLSPPDFVRLQMIRFQG